MPWKEGVRQFALQYALYHGPVSVSVCIFGIITNVFNIIVLTRRNMHTPVNYILSWLAVSDIITMLSYVPFAVHFYCMYHPIELTPDKNSKAWMTFLLFHVNLTATTHTVSIWLCVLLAIIRYLHISSPTKGMIMRLRRIHQAKVLIVVIFMSSAILQIPNYMTNRLEEVVVDNDTCYRLDDLRLGKNNTEVTVLVNVWLYAMTAKLIPCVLMTIFGSLLIYSIHSKVKQRRRLLQISGANSLRLSEHARTTKMLLAVIILFLITELPQGILVLMSAIFTDFFDSIYLPLGDVMDIIALVNNAINFVLYCTMSGLFRKVFIQLFLAPIMKERLNIGNGMMLREHSDTNSVNNNK